MPKAKWLIIFGTKMTNLDMQADRRLEWWTKRRESRDRKCERKRTNAKKRPIISPITGSPELGSCTVGSDDEMPTDKRGVAGQPYECLKRYCSYRPHTAFDEGLPDWEAARLKFSR